MPEITAEHLDPAPAGVRAQAITPDGKLLDDFAFSETRRVVHVLNAPSPAATAYGDQVGEGFDCLSEGVSVGDTAQQHRALTSLCHKVGKMLGSIINNPTSFLLSPP